MQELADLRDVTEVKPSKLECERVLLINQERIPHYRVSVYNYLSQFLARHGVALSVVSEGVQPNSGQVVEFDHIQTRLGFFNLKRVIMDVDPHAVIYWVRLRHLYLFPLLVLLKALGKRSIYWGHGTDLSHGSGMWFKRWANSIEYEISDALILYGEHQRCTVKQRFHSKTFIANNTLCFNDHPGRVANRAASLAKHGITTRKNIICVGRMQKRKRLDHLFEAFKRMDNPDTGLILVGPDTDNVLADISGPRIYKLGPIYGDERLDLMSAADVFCLPGAVGLSIVDAFHCGLPLVTENGDESPEIMYLKDGINGMVVPRGDIRALADKLQLLLQNDKLRDTFSRAARQEIGTNGHIETMSRGFLEAIRHAGRHGAVQRTV
jgi:glycosyltransferase involved in cell wall biosynthesis